MIHGHAESVFFSAWICDRILSERQLHNFRHERMTLSWKKIDSTLGQVVRDGELWHASSDPAASRQASLLPLMSAWVYRGVMAALDRSNLTRRIE